MAQPSGSPHLQVPDFEQTNISEQLFITAPEMSESIQNVSTPRNSSLNPHSTPQNRTTSTETIPLYLHPPHRFSFPQQSSRFSEDFSSSESTHHNSNHHSRSTFYTLTKTPSPHPNPLDPESPSPKNETTTHTSSPPQPIHFRSMTWLHCAFIMIAETISLGILALPSVLSTIGLIPGMILIILMGILAWYSGLLIHRFRTAYPTIISWADACSILLTPFGIPNSYTYVDYLFGYVDGWEAFASIGTAVIVTMISVGVRAPAKKTYSLWPQKDLSLREAFLSVTNIVFAYGMYIFPSLP
ncbi:hypothetical protein BPOR_1104g00010 [Botrytis porri]|uniref:Amino acid transporter transmembrane domain-containing protein n=1 Tax=Botrytis porri TaxID=87229 RepID=A0A4Z1K5Z5_9HELO|nr:hypothetical protein BPOR_1104g00010 [Botrytis porri]